LKQNLKGYIPVIITAFISITLIILFYYHQPAHPQHLPGKFSGKRPERHEGGGIFKLMGSGAIIVGAFSFSWYLLKKKLKSPFKIIKMTAKKVFSFHTFAGWAALALVAIHGGYYLITDFTNTKNLTGAAAFLLLLCLAVYGYMLNRKKKKVMRSAHFILCIMWIIAAFVHGGSLVIICGVVLAVLFVGITWFEKREKKLSELKTAENQ
jgi:ABC-type Fe3+ transport system permease subunit